MAANWHTLTSDIKIIAKELASLTVLKVMNELKKTLWNIVDLLSNDRPYIQKERTVAYLGGGPLRLPSPLWYEENFLGVSVAYL